MPRKGKEQRKHRRVSLISDVECVYGGMVTQRPKRIMDLSVEGMFVYVILPPPPGTMVSLKFRLIGYEDPIMVASEVRYSQEGIGMGVKFLDLKPEDKEKIRKVVEKLK